jgi:hypothetical protein
LHVVSLPQSPLKGLRPSCATSIIRLVVPAGGVKLSYNPNTSDLDNLCFFKGSSYERPTKKPTRRTGSGTLPAPTGTKKLEQEQDQQQHLDQQLEEKRKQRQKEQQEPKQQLKRKQQKG